MKRSISILLTLAVLLFAVHGMLYAADAAAGKDLYTKKCKMCHGDDGAGTPAMQKKFGDKLKPLGSPEIQKMKDDQLTKAFKDAANHKALLKTTTDADITNVIAFIRTLKK